MSQAITVDNVSKKFRIYHERHDSLKATVLRGRRGRYDDFWAVRDLSFEVGQGEAFGIIGHNGSGKSTMLKCLAKILTPESGRISINGSMSALLELGAGFHPELSGRENVYLNGAILGLRKRDIDKRIDDIIAFAGLEEFTDMPVKNYSSGMMAKLGFSIAINVEPEILLIDEVLAVGDEQFQRQCVEKINQFRDEGRTIVLVSHGLDQVRNLCSNVIWLERGELRAAGAAADVIDTYVAEVHGSRTIEEREGAARWGSGEIRVTDIDIIDGGGRSVAVVRTGEPVTFRIRYTAVSEVKSPTLGLGVHTLDGVLVTGPNSGEYSSTPPRLIGDGTVDIHVDSLSLNEGTYDLSVGFSDATLFHTYDYWQRPVRFDVVRGDHYEQHGIVTLKPTFNWSSPARSGAADHRR